jgi:hypothetical protein
MHGHIWLWAYRCLLAKYKYKQYHNVLAEIVFKKNCIPLIDTLTLTVASICI